MPSSAFFFFNDTATTEIYTLSLHDALPIFEVELAEQRRRLLVAGRVGVQRDVGPDTDDDLRARSLQRELNEDRKSTRLNSSHQIISYAVFCLKKKKMHISNRFTLPAPALLR